MASLDTGDPLDFHFPECLDELVAELIGASADPDLCSGEREDDFAGPVA
jgi:hypothetical protein